MSTEKVADPFFFLQNAKNTLFKYLPIFGLLSGVTFVSLILGILTNKVIAVLLGPSGIGQIGLYRNLANTLSGILSLGYSMVFMQQISVDKSPQKFRQILAAGMLLIGFQCFGVIFLALSFAAPVTAWVLGLDTSLLGQWTTRFVLAMAVPLSAYQFYLSLVRGKGEIRVLSQTQVFQSLVGIVTIFGLVKMGSLGLAIHVGLASGLAVVFGLFLLRRQIGKLNLHSFRDGFRFLKEKSSSSLVLSWQSFIVPWGLLTFQVLLQKSQGTDVLGNYNAAYMLIDTSTLILMSSVRSYFLPQFGECKTLQEKRDLLKQMISLLLFFATVGILLTSLLAGPVIRILFTSEFKVAASFLVAMSLSLIPAVFSWSYNTFLLHQGENLLFTTLDTIWILMLVGCAYLLNAFSMPAIGFPLAYTGCAFLGCIGYLTITTLRFGRSYVSREILLYGLLAFTFGASLLFFRG